MLIVDRNRVGNSLIGFSSESLVFCERKSDSPVKNSKSQLSDGSDLLLGIKMGENCQKSEDRKSEFPTLDRNYSNDSVALTPPLPPQHKVPLVMVTVVQWQPRTSGSGATAATASHIATAAILFTLNRRATRPCCDSHTRISFILLSLYISLTLFATNENENVVSCHCCQPHYLLKSSGSRKKQNWL